MPVEGQRHVLLDKVGGRHVPRRASAHTVESETVQRNGQSRKHAQLPATLLAGCIPLDLLHLVILVTGFNRGNRNLTRNIAIASMILAEYMYGIFVKPAQNV